MRKNPTVKFYENAETERIRFVVVICRMAGQWLLVKHRERDTYEIPAGHREEGETPDAAAERELREETGALDYRIERLCAYSVTGKTPVNASGGEAFGMLYYAELFNAGKIESEIECSRLFSELPKNLTYPDIQPAFIGYVRARKGI